MGDTTPIPAPSRGLSGSANLTVQVKFVPDQPLLPWQRKFGSTSSHRLVVVVRVVTVTVVVTHWRTQSQTLWQRRSVIRPGRVVAEWTTN